MRLVTILLRILTTDTFTCETTTLLISVCFCQNSNKSVMKGKIVSSSQRKIFLMKNMCVEFAILCMNKILCMH